LHKLEENIDPAQLHKSKTVPRSVLYKIKLSVADATESCILDSNKLYGKEKTKSLEISLKTKLFDSAARTSTYFLILLEFMLTLTLH